MRSIQVTALEGPSGVVVREVPDATACDSEVLVEVRALGISWPDLLLTKGKYQLKPAVPFQLGVDFSGTVRAAPEDSGFQVGDRVACVLPYGGGGELVSVPAGSVFRLPDSVSFEKAAALPMNYLTAEFALTVRGEVTEGSTVLINGAAGGVGTACIQVARGLGARVITVVSTEEKAQVAKAAGAHEALLADGFLTLVKELTSGVGVDVVVDVVGEPLMTDSLRALGPLGRLLVVGFTGGEIPMVRVSRLLLNNIDVRGVGWGAYASRRPGFMHAQWERLVPLMESGAVDPPLGTVYSIDQVAEALVEMEARRTLGKSVAVF